MPKNLGFLPCSEEKSHIWPSGVHFILSVFKVVRVKVLLFLLVVAYFIKILMHQICLKNHASKDGQMCNFSSEHARDPRFLGMGNHLEPFTKVSDPPEGQEQAGGAVGGQG